MVAIKDLLQHDSQFEDGKYFVEFYLRQVVTGARRVAFEHLCAREPAGATRH